MLSHDKDRMTRIGFTYNLKPEPEAMSDLHAEIDAGDEGEADEPPSWQAIGPERPSAQRSADQPTGSQRATDQSTNGREPADRSTHAQRVVDDEFAEWDDAETIDAVEHALSALGEVIRLEATMD